MSLGERIKERRFQLGALAIIIAVVCVIAIVTKGTDSTCFCNYCHKASCGVSTCHEMRAQLDEVQASKHRNIACIQCHFRGVTKLSALPASVFHLAGLDVAVNVPSKKASNAKCIKCHDYPPIVYLRADLAYDLKKHVEAGDVYCSECHMRKDHVIKSKPVDRLLQ
ncbi:MAG: hypothetical protein QMD08_06045 [Actinomycetota bacterium]|nr:hypothetical protein [Actinomycetota bacterium]